MDSWSSIIIRWVHGLTFYGMTVRKMSLEDEYRGEKLLLHDALHTLTHEHGKLGPRTTKIVFIGYPKRFQGYVMYGEHLNGGMTSIDSRSLDFFQDKFSSIGKIKKDSN